MSDCVWLAGSCGARQCKRQSIHDPGFPQTGPSMLLYGVAYKRDVEALA